ncbi:hypothetical protein DAIF1_21240 [Stenotrophomonas indicatrix]|nr:hypothetical protein DAIF1_21240 [Stenotrophomonas indicatrix]
MHTGPRLRLARKGVRTKGDCSHTSTSASVFLASISAQSRCSWGTVRSRILRMIVQCSGIRGVPGRSADNAGRSSRSPASAAMCIMTMANCAGVRPYCCRKRSVVAAPAMSSPRIRNCRGIALVSNDRCSQICCSAIRRMKIAGRPSTPTRCPIASHVTCVMKPVSSSVGSGRSSSGRQPANAHFTISNQTWGSRWSHGIPSLGSRFNSLCATSMKPRARHAPMRSLTCRSSARPCSTGIA